MSFVTCITSQCVIWRTMNLNYEIEVSNYCYIGSETRSLPTDQPTTKAIWHLLLRNINNNTFVITYILKHRILARRRTLGMT